MKVWPSSEFEIESELPREELLAALRSVVQAPPGGLEAMRLSLEILANRGLDLPMRPLGDAQLIGEINDGGFLVYGIGSNHQMGVVAVRGRLRSGEVGTIVAVRMGLSMLGTVGLLWMLGVLGVFSVVGLVAWIGGGGPFWVVCIIPLLVAVLWRLGTREFRRESDRLTRVLVDTNCGSAQE